MFARTNYQIHLQPAERRERLSSAFYDVVGAEKTKAFLDRRAFVHTP
ncbi:hypothetical protein [Spirosoma areae]